MSFVFLFWVLCCLLWRFLYSGDHRSIEARDLCTSSYLWSRLTLSTAENYQLAPIDREVKWEKKKKNLLIWNKILNLLFDICRIVIGYIDTWNSSTITVIKETYSVLNISDSSSYYYSPSLYFINREFRATLSTTCNIADNCRDSPDQGSVEWWASS